MLDNILGYRKVTVDGHSFWVNPINGRVYPMINGAADGDENEPDTTPKFTQADMDRVMGRTRDEAKRAAASELATQLGCTPEEAKIKIARAAHFASRGPRILLAGTILNQAVMAVMAVIDPLADSLNAGRRNLFWTD